MSKSRFRRYLDRHNQYVHKIAKILDGDTYATAPFDISTKDRQFYEIKVTARYALKRYERIRFLLSTDELKFLHLVKNAYHIILILLDDPPVAFLINYEQLQKWENDYIRKGWKLQRVKEFDVGKKRLSSFTHFQMN